MPGGEGASSHWHVRTARCGAGQAPGCQASPICAHADQVPGCQASPICAHAHQVPGCQASPICAHADQAPDCQASPICAHADHAPGCQALPACTLRCPISRGRHAVDGDKGGAAGGVGSGRATSMGAAGLLATRTQAVGRPGWCSHVSQQLRLTEQQGPPDRRADQPLHTPVAPRSRVQQLRRCPAVARRPTVPLAARRRRPGRATGGRRTGGPTNSAARRPSPRSPSNRCRRIGRAPPSSSLSLSTNSSARRPSPLRALGDNGAGDVGACSQCDQLALRYALGLVACRGSARE